jgi:hypothetical protein
MSTMVKQDNPATMGGSDSEPFSQNRQIRSAQVIGDLGYNDEIERSGGHLARKRCPNKADVSTSHAPSRLGYCGRRTVDRLQAKSKGSKETRRLANCASEFQYAAMLVMSAGLQQHLSLEILELRVRVVPRINILAKLSFEARHINRFHRSGLK